MHLRDKILELEKENNDLMHDYSENINLKIENNALRKLLELKLREGFDTVPAKVIGYYNSKWQSELLIDAGKTKGVADGMAVVTEKGLAGTVILASNYTSQVRLLNDPQSAIGSRILSSRKLGMVEGSLEKEIFLNYIPAGEEVFIGDILITSEFGEYIPPELLIGRIKKIGQSEDVYYRQIIVEPFVDFETLEFVLVLK